MDTTTNILLLNPEFAKKLTDSHEAFLKKVKYWTEKCGRTIQGEQGEWIYNSLKEWEKQFPRWSRSKLRRVIAFLEETNLIFTKKVNAKKWNHTKWYSINLEKFYQFFKKPSKEFDRKRTNRCVQNEQIINIQETNYTNNKNSLSSEKLVERPEEEREEIKKIKGEKTPKQEHNRTKRKILEAQNIANNMTECWNKVFANLQNKVKAYSNKKLIFKLQGLYETRFKHDLKEWESYAKKVLSSKFLIGEKSDFKASFTWLLKEDVIEAILNGEYGVGDRTLDISTDSDDSIAGKMLEIWQSHITSQEASLKLTRNRVEKLKNIFKNHFQSELEKWKKFVTNVTRSTFLMGGVTNFKVSLWWAIKEENLLRIREGAYHSKEELAKIVEENKHRRVLETLKNNDLLDPRWKKTMLDVFEQFGERTYISWFKNIKFEAANKGILALKMPTKMDKEHIERYYKRRLLEIATKYFGTIAEMWLLSPDEKLEDLQRKAKQKELIDSLMKSEFSKWERKLTIQQRNKINPFYRKRSEELFATALLKAHFRQEILIPELRKEGRI